MRNVIEVTGLTKSYSNLKAVNNLSFNVANQEILGLLGPNGSGKSTIINCILSLLNFESGSIKIFGEVMTPTSYETKSKIGVIFQDVAVFSELTVYDNINYFCGLYIKDKETRKTYVQEAIKLVGLEDFIKFYPKKLSGGLLRRLNIACGIAHKPSLIFLDEPTVAVDPQSRNNILEGIKELNRQGATIIYTTHYMEEVEDLCNRIIIIDKGHIIASGTNEELKSLINVGEKIVVEVNAISDEHLKAINDLSNVIKATLTEKTLHISYHNPNQEENHNIADLVEFLKINKIKYQKIFSELPSLNDVFLELTGKELRD